MFKLDIIDEVIKIYTVNFLNNCSKLFVLIRSNISNEENIEVIKNMINIINKQYDLKTVFNFSNDNSINNYCTMFDNISLNF